MWVINGFFMMSTSLVCATFWITIFVRGLVKDVSTLAGVQAHTASDVKRIAIKLMTTEDFRRCNIRVSPPKDLLPAMSFRAIRTAGARNPYSITF